MFSQNREFSEVAVKKFQAAIEADKAETDMMISAMVANMPSMTGVIAKAAVETATQPTSAPVADDGGWQAYLAIVKTSLEEQARRTGGIRGPTNNDEIDVYLDSINGDDLYCEVERTTMQNDSAMPADVEYEVACAFPSIPKNVKWAMVAHLCGRAAIHFDDEMAKEYYTDDDYVPEEEEVEEYWEFNEEVGTATPAVETVADKVETTSAPPVLVKPVIGGFDTQYYRFIKHEVELTGAYEVQVGYRDPKRGVARCLFPVTTTDSDRVAVIEMLQHGLFNGLDTLHCHLCKYRIILNPLANDGMGVAQGTDYGGKVHRVPFIITFNGLPVSEMAFGDYLSRD